MELIVKLAKWQNWDVGTKRLIAMNMFSFKSFCVSNFSFLTEWRPQITMWTSNSHKQNLASNHFYYKAIYYHVCDKNSRTCQQKCLYPTLLFCWNPERWSTKKICKVCWVCCHECILSLMARVAVLFFFFFQPRKQACWLLTMLPFQRCWRNSSVKSGISCWDYYWVIGWDVIQPRRTR